MVCTSVIIMQSSVCCCVWVVLLFIYTRYALLRSRFAIDFILFQFLFYPFICGWVLIVYVRSLESLHFYTLHSNCCRWFSIWCWSLIGSLNQKCCTVVLLLLPAAVCAALLPTPFSWCWCSLLPDSWAVRCVRFYRKSRFGSIWKLLKLRIHTHLLFSPKKSTASSQRAVSRPARSPLFYLATTAVMNVFMRCIL